LGEGGFQVFGDLGGDDLSDGQSRPAGMIGSRLNGGLVCS